LRLTGCNLDLALREHEMMDQAVNGFPPGDLRVSDADRDLALAELGEAFQVGRIAADELDQRSGQVLTARTRTELAVPLADLPLAHIARKRAADIERARRAARRRIAAGAAAVGGIAFAAASVRIALNSGASLQQREINEQIMAHQGMSVSLPPAVGFDGMGTIATGMLALLLLLVFILLRATSSDAR
jgi:hypothetical protein